MHRASELTQGVLGIGVTQTGPNPHTTIRPQFDDGANLIHAGREDLPLTWHRRGP